MSGMWTPDTENEVLADDIDHLLAVGDGEILSMEKTSIIPDYTLVGEVKGWVIRIPNGRRFRLALTDIGK
jgi:hypothetical protein